MTNPPDFAPLPEALLAEFHAAGTEESLDADARLVLLFCAMYVATEQRVAYALGLSSRPFSKVREYVFARDMIDLVPGAMGQVWEARHWDPICEKCDGPMNHYGARVCSTCGARIREPGRG